MRLKQLIVVVLTLVLSSAFAAAAGPQLTNVSVVAENNSTVVNMHATGNFRHSEYRASENLLIVDLTGVSVGNLHDQQRKLQSPGVESYRVVGYKGVGGVDVARLELKLVPGADTKVRASDGELTIRVSGTAPVVATNTAAAKPAPSTTKPRLVKVTQVSVKRGNGSMNVEVTGNGPMNGKVMKLVSPDRVVLDIVNAVPAGRPRTIAVNASDLKDVRMGRFQNQPPVTRVVVDLLSAHDYELKNDGNKLVLRVLSGPKAAEAPVQRAAAVEKPVEKPVPAVTPVVAKSAASRAKLLPAAQVETSPTSTNPVEVATNVAKPVAEAHSVQPKGDAQPGTAQPVVFVEPKYQAKAAQSQDAPVPAADNVQQQPTAEMPQQPAAETQAPAQSTPPAETPAAQQPQASTPQRSVNFALEQQEKQKEPVVEKPKYTGEPISVNLKDVDIKDFFRLIHEISGLNIVLDPSVSGTLTIVLDDVPWDQALDIVLQNNGLDRQLEGNVLRIATVQSLAKEAELRRQQVEAQALAVNKVNVTRFLSYAHAKDVLPTVKKLLSSRGDIVADERTNALIIQDIPSVIPEIDRLLAQLDRKTQEVEIEARVVAATRTFARDIGVQLGFGWGNGVSAVGGVQKVGNSPLIDNMPTNPLYFLNDAKQIPLFSNLIGDSPTSGISFLNATNAYRVDAILAMAESRGLLKILSRPRVVTQNNIQALVKQGFRVPVVTLGQLGGPPSVTYIEAVLRLTVTPQITVENTIFLNVDIENTSPDFSRQVLGNPVFLTQQATTQVLVTDGGTVMIGGVIQTQNSVNVQQVPLLGNIPVLGNLFKRRSVQNSTQELIFILTPKIIQT